jgi:O-antigen/teichoic acid export membrane protein
MINEIKNIFVKNFFNLSLNQILNVLFTLIITPILFKNLGSDQFGLISLYLTIVMLLSIIIGYGYNLNSPQRLASFNTKHQIQTLLVEILSVRIIISILLLLFSVSITPLLNLTINQFYILTFSLIILLSEAINPFFYYQGKDSLHGFALSNFIFKLFYFILIVFFVKLKSDAFLVNLFFGLSSLTVYAFCWVYIFRKENLTWYWINFKIFIDRIKENMFFTLSSLASYISVSSSLIILSFFVNNNELGKYSLAQKIGFLLRMIPVLITQSVLQIASRKNSNDKKNLNKFLNKTYSLGLIFSLFIGLIIIIFSKWIIYYMSGEYIDYSQKILIILSLIPFFSMLNFKNMIIILVNEMKEVLYVTTWYCVLFLLIIGSLLSYLFGGVGLSISLILTEIFNYFLCQFFIKKNESK